MTECIGSDERVPRTSNRSQLVPPTKLADSLPMVTLLNSGARQSPSAAGTSTTSPLSVTR